MTLADAFDLLLCLLILGVGWGAIAGRALFTGVALYVVYGLLLALAWVRLGAVDVALAEAAIGAGLTGLLLLGAVGRLGEENRPRVRVRSASVAACAIVGAILCWAALSLNHADLGLRVLVEDNLAMAGAENPVTAVLLNFRAYDTLLEAIVLLIALVGVWALALDEDWDGRPGIPQHVRPDGVLATFGRFLPPIGLVVGIYLVWVGTSAPGGAFQGGTVLAAVWLLAMMAGLARPPRLGSVALRWLLVAGPLLFLIVGLFGLLHGGFLAYPQGYAKPLILVVEFGLALSIAATLALLVAGYPRRIPCSRR